MKGKIWMVILACSLMYSMTAFAGGFSFDGDRITYVSEDGSRVTGWFQDGDGNWYHFDEDGYARVGWYEENGKRYYFRIGSWQDDREIVRSPWMEWSTDLMEMA